MNIVREDWRVVKMEHDALWLLVFNHSTSFGFFKSKEHAGLSFDEGLFSIMSRISRRTYVNRYNKSYEFLLEYPNEYKGQYNHWIQSKDPLKDPEIEGVVEKAAGYSPIHIDWNDNSWGGLKKGLGFALIDGCGNGGFEWYYGIGDFHGQYKDKTAGQYAGDVTLVNLWLRISLKPYIVTQRKQRTSMNRFLLVYLFFIS